MRLIAAGVAGELWGGATFGSKTRGSSPHTRPTEDLHFAQRTLGGWVGEWFDDPRRMRPGSSTDEIVLAKMICENTARKLNRDPTFLFFEELAAVKAILNANRPAHEALAARLMRKSTIGPNALKKYLTGVKLASVDERSA